MDNRIANVAGSSAEMLQDAIASIVHEAEELVRMQRRHNTQGRSWPRRSAELALERLAKYVSDAQQELAVLGACDVLQRMLKEGDKPHECVRT